MRKLSQREALRHALKKAIDSADKPTLGNVAEVLAQGFSYSDERNAFLVVMSDAEIESGAFPTEQARAREERDTRRSAHQAGMTKRNDCEAGAISS